ncbi:unnamed protein product, partial [Polarella glacialis]
HVPALAQRFPGFDFELYDPADFDERLLELAASQGFASRVKVNRGFFDDEAARAVAARKGQGPIIFFCDIRTADEQSMAESQIQQFIERDMDRQQAW